MTQTLEDLLSLFLKREEIAPNVFRVSLAVGEHLVGVEIRAPEGALFLRALPLEALPEPLARHAGVKERITHFGDIVKSGRLGRDDSGRPILEVDLAALDGSRETYFGVLEAVAIDCARLRGASEGLVAGLEMAQAMGSRSPVPAAITAPAPAAAKTPAASKTLAPLDAPAAGRTRVWESMLQQSLPPSLQKLAQQKREETLAQGASAKADAAAARADRADAAAAKSEAASAAAAKSEAASAAAAAEPPSEAPAGPGAHGFRLGGVPPASQPFSAPPGLSPMEPPSEVPSTWEDLERELLGANPENPPSQHSAISGAPSPAISHGSIPAPTRAQTPLALLGAESSQIFASSLSAGAPTRAQDDSGSDVFSGAPTKAAAALTDSFLEDIPSSMASPPQGRGASATSSLTNSPLAGSADGDAPAPPAGPKPRTSIFSKGAPPAPAAEEEGPGRLKKIGFFAGQQAGAHAVPDKTTAAPAGDHAGSKNRKSLFQPGGKDAQPGGKDRASNTTSFAKDAIPSASADPFTEAPPAPKAPAGATRRFEKFDLGPAPAPAGKEKAPAPPPEKKEKAPRAHGGAPEKLPGGAGGTGGANATVPIPRTETKSAGGAPAGGGAGDLLSWMDEVEGGGEVAAPAEEPPPRRKNASLVIPKALMVKVKDAAREWYKRQDKETLVIEVKKGNDALFVSTGEEPGESSWRFRKQTLRLSRPSVDTGTSTFHPEPQELTVEEVEAWLVSEGLLREEDIEKAHRAQKLFESAWTLRAEGKLGEAEGALREVLDLQPDNILAMTALGHLYRKELARPDEALKLYGKALETAPKFAPALLGRAALQVESDRHKAYEDAMAALALSPRDPDLLELAGIVAMRANRKARAKELFVKLYRVDRSRGEQALELVDVERGGEVKWDPRLVVWERAGLAKGGLDSVVQALYEERVALAKRFDDLLREYKDLTPDQKRSKLSQLSDSPSYGFFYELLPLYIEETDEAARAAIEGLFKGAPAQANMAIEDAVLSGDHDRAIAGLRLAGICGLHELVKPALEGFRRMTLTRHVRAMSTELVKLGGGEAALALLAKLERGEREPMDALMELLGRRPDEPAEEAAAAVHGALSVRGGVNLDDDDRLQLFAAAEPTAEALAERSSTVMKKQARMQRLKELEEELGGATPKKKKKDGEDES